MSRARTLSKVLLASALALLACDRDKDAAQSQSASSPTAATQPLIQPITFPPENGPLPKIDGDRAMQYVKDIVKFGPRPLSSANHKKVEDYIENRLKGEQVEDDSFTAKTPVGEFPVHNIVAKYPGHKRRNHYHRQSLRYELSSAQHLIRRCQ